MEKGFKKGHKGFERKNKELVYCWTCGEDIKEKDAIKSGENFYCSEECKKFAEE